MNELRASAGAMVIATLLCGNALLYAVVFAQERAVLTVAFLDVGQGDAIYIEAPNGNQMLIDGGPNAAVLRALSRVMPFYDRSLDIIVATHPDKDHIAGLIDIIERYDVELFLEPGVVGDTGVYRALERAVALQGIPRMLARRDMRIDLGHGVYADILFPDREVANVETNTGSVILRLVYGDTAFMLTGDAPQAIEKYIVGVGGGSIKSEVLKAGHHGSRTSSSPEFVAAVAPRYAVISAGTGNAYGHPHREVIDRFTLLGATILNTAEAGTVTFASDGRDVFRK